MESHSSEGQEQVKDLKISNGLGALAVFNKNHHFAYIYKKTEKLVTAVYMITNFIKDTEPLKWRIRERALELMSLNLSFNIVSLGDRRELLKKYQAYSLEIVSFSSIAQMAGLMSEMNFNILSREFNGLVEVIEKDENKKSNEETVVLGSDFFDTPRNKQPETSAPIAASLSSSYTAHVAHSQPARDVLYKGQEITVKDTKETAEKPASQAHKKVESKDDRQASIVKLLGKKSGLNVKDFTTIIKGVSEKTIQRELLSMVASGVLKKEGERRWSTYSLA